jgi:hypothetical protein
VAGSRGGMGRSAIGGSEWSLRVRACLRLCEAVGRWGDRGVGRGMKIADLGVEGFRSKRL